MTQRQSPTPSLPKISTLKIDFLLEMFQLPQIFKSPRENQFSRSKFLEDSPWGSASGSCSTPLLIFSTPPCLKKKEIAFPRRLTGFFCSNLIFWIPTANETIFGKCLEWSLQPAQHSWGSYQNQQVVSKRPTSLGRAIPVRQGPKEARGLYLPLKVSDSSTSHASPTLVESGTLTVHHHYVIRWAQIIKLIAEMDYPPSY